MPPRLEQQATEPHRRERRVPWYRYPYKIFYIVFQFSFLGFVKLPYVSLLYLIPRARPCTEWSWFQAIGHILVRDGIRIALNCGLVQNRKDVEKGDMPLREKLGMHCRGVWIEPVREEDVVGEVREIMLQNEVQPRGLAAYWYGEGVGRHEEVHPAGPDEKVLVHFHGGGYILGSAHPGGAHERLPHAILKHSQSTPSPPIHRMINVEYRLIRCPPLVPLANSFPASLLDGLSVVHYLIFTLGFHPRNIILSGDSAGGNLVLGLTRYLRDAPLPVASVGQEERRRLEEWDVKSLLPSAMLLQSPWCDVASTHIPERSPAGKNCSFVRNANTDIVGRYPYSSQRPELGMSAYALRGMGGHALSALQVAQNPFLSPASLDLPMYIYDTSSLPDSAPNSTPPAPPHLHENREEKKEEDKPERGRMMFEGYPPAYFAVGGKEMLFDENELMVERLQRQAFREYIVDDSTVGKKDGEGYKWVTLDVEPYMWHDFIASPFARTEAKRVVGRMVDWMGALPKGREYVV